VPVRGSEHPCSAEWGSIELLQQRRNWAACACRHVVLPVKAHALEHTLRSATPARPPPRLTVAANSFPLSSLAVCFCVFALPGILNNAE
jgi:hypothetical protein